MENFRKHIKERIKSLENMEIVYQGLNNYDMARQQSAIKTELYDLITFIDNNAYNNIEEKLK